MYALYDVRSPGDYRYVGRTVASLSRRLWRHRRTVDGMPHLRVARWMSKVGRHNVRIIELGQYPEDTLPFWECHWMAALRESGCDLTNMAHGGSGSGFSKGHYKHTPETRARMSASLRGRSGPWTGKKRSPETKAAIRDGMLRAWAEGRH